MRQRQKTADPARDLIPERKKEPSLKKATIKDVAREAGVSMATASNVMNNPDIVKPQTRDAVTVLLS